MNEWFRSPAAWTALGFVGQILFGSRFFVQWWASERRKRELNISCPAKPATYQAAEEPNHSFIASPREWNNGAAVT